MLLKYLGELIKLARKRFRAGFWIIYIPILIWGILTFIGYIKDPNHRTILGPLNLAIHELGHVLFLPFGKFTYFLGGTIAQLSVPIIAGITLLVGEQDLFGAAFCLAWLGTNFFEVATYIADARTKSLPLVGLIPNPQHDWNYLLKTLGMLQYDYIIANLMRFIGYLTFLIFIISNSALILVSVLDSVPYKSYQQFTENLEIEDISVIKDNIQEGENDGRDYVSDN